MHDANRPDIPQAASVRAGAAARDAAPHGAGACPPCGGDVIPHGGLVQQRSPLVGDRDLDAGAHAPLIEVAEASCSYPGAARPALDRVCLHVMPGERICVLGGNGSGKSTLLQLMSGLIAPDAGSVRIAGSDISRGGPSAHAARREVALVLQNPEDQMVTSVVEDDVAFGPENLGVPREQIAERVAEALAAVGMAEEARRDPADLSGGQRQRVALAGALAMRPRALLLDEPCAMLDPAGRSDVMACIDGLHERGIAVVHVTHFMDDALGADRVVVMDRGAIVCEGAPRDVFSRVGELQDLGLEPPFPLELARRLRAGGLDICPPCALDARALAHRVAELLNVRRAGDDAPAGSPAADGLFTTGTAPGDTHAGDTPTCALTFDNVSFSYGDAAAARRRIFPQARHRTQALPSGSLAVSDLSAEIAFGHITALVGRTGSGKSTTAELACALKLPRSGHVTVAGIDTADLARRKELRKTVGYATQLPEHQLFAETVFDDVAFGPRNLGADPAALDALVRRSLERCGLAVDDALLARSPFALSGGQQRLVALAGVLAMDQPLLVLDEPMAGLDPAGRSHMRSLLLRLRADGKAILMIAHDMDDVAELADRMIALEDGRIVAHGRPRDVFTGASTGTGEEEDAGAGTTDGLSIDHRNVLDALGIPKPLAFARELARIGAPLPHGPITLDELVEEVLGYGLAR